MITAKEARKISKERGLSNDILKRADQEIRIMSQRGKYEFCFDCGTTDEVIVKEVLAGLKNAGYKTISVSNNSTILISW